MSLPGGVIHVRAAEGCVRQLLAVCVAVGVRRGVGDCIGLVQRKILRAVRCADQRAGCCAFSVFAHDSQLVERRPYARTVERDAQILKIDHIGVFRCGDERVRCAVPHIFAHTGVGYGKRGGPETLERHPFCFIVRDLQFQAAGQKNAVGGIIKSAQTDFRHGFFAAEVIYHRCAVGVWCGGICAVEAQPVGVVPGRACRHTVRQDRGGRAVQQLARTFQSKAVGQIHAGQVVRRYVGALVGRFTVEYLDLVDEQPDLEIDVQFYIPGLRLGAFFLGHGVDEALDAAALDDWGDIRLGQCVPACAVVGKLDAHGIRRRDAGAFFAKKIHLDLFKAFGFSQIYDEFKAVLHLIVITDPFRRFAGKRTAVNTVRELPAVIRVAAGGCPRAGIRASGGKVYAVARVRVHHGRRLGRIGFGAHVDLIHADVMDGAVGDLGRRDIKFIAQIPRCDRRALRAGPFVAVAPLGSQLRIVEGGKRGIIRTVFRGGEREVFHLFRPAVDDGTDAGGVHSAGFVQVYGEYDMVVRAVGSRLHVDPAPSVHIFLRAVYTIREAGFAAVINGVAGIDGHFRVEGRDAFGQGGRAHARNGKGQSGAQHAPQQGMMLFHDSSPFLFFL